jgi:predicted  nucleic acid-binding Zn-ribbon protein
MGIEMQLVVYSGLPTTTDCETSDTVHDKIQHLEEEIGELQDNITGATTAISDFHARMVEQHTDLVAESRMLEAQILDLERDFLSKARQKANVPDDQDDELDEFADGKAQESPTEAQATLRKMCKKLYRKLAMLTHPDRTKNKRKRELFKEIKEAYRNLDLNKLMAIRDELDAGVDNVVEISTLLSQLMERFNNLTAQVKQLRTQWKALRDSDDYMLAMLYESAPEITSDNFRLYMLQQIEMLRMKYQFMKNTYDLQSKRP